MKYLLLTNFVVYTALHLPHRGPALFLFYFGVIMEDLVSQPGKVVNTHLIFLSLKVKQKIKRDSSL